MRNFVSRSLRSGLGAGAVAISAAMMSLSLSLSPASADSIDEVNRCYDQLVSGDYQLAAYHCTLAIDARALPYMDLYTAHVNRGVAYRYLEQYDRAIEDYTYAMKVRPGDFLAYQNRGNIYRILGKYDKALKDLNVSLKLKKNNAGALYVRGLTYEELGNMAAARLDFQKAHELDPNNEDISAKAWEYG